MTTVTDTHDMPLPKKFVVEYGAMTKDANSMFHRRVEATLSRKMGGRWRSSFDTLHDRAIFEQRPEMPTMIKHPGAEIYKGEIPKEPILYYGKGEDGKLVGWTLNNQTVHTLVIGPTGGGKTTVFRSLISGAVCQGIPVYAVDPKRIELRPFEGFPGIGGIASAPGKMAQMIEDMHALMMKRYTQIEKNEVTRKDLDELIFILDEYAILTRVLTNLWKNERDEEGKKRSGTPIWLQMITDMIFLARSARIRLVIGTQRPDAKMFEGGARDSLQHRISLSRLSGQGAKMLWGNFYTGTDTPLVSGRAVCAPDGSKPIEVQTFWLDDPWGVKNGTEDAKILQGIRELAEERFFGYPFPIDPEKYQLFDPRINPHEATSENATTTIDDEAPEEETESEEKFATNGEITERGEYETEGVRAESLCEGDMVLLDSGNYATVTEIEDMDDDGEDRVLLTLDEYGDTIALDLESTEFIERVIDSGEE